MYMHAHIHNHNYTHPHIHIHEHTHTHTSSSTDNADNSIYICSIFPPQRLPSNVLISVLVLELSLRRLWLVRELPVFTATHIKEGL